MILDDGVRHELIGGALEIYRMAIEWSADDDNEPLDNAHVVFAGGLAILKGEPLFEVRVPHMAGRREHEFILTRLKEYVDYE